MAGEVISLTPEQEQEFWQGQQPVKPAAARVINPLVDFSAEDLAKLEQEDPKNFSLIAALHADKAAQKNPAIISKVADAYDLLTKQQTPLRTAKEFISQATPGAILKAGAEFGRGAVKQVANVAQIAPYLGLKASEALDVAAGVPTRKEDIEDAQEKARRIAESVASMEAGGFSLAEHAPKNALSFITPLVPGLSAARKLIEPEAKPEDKVTKLYNALALHEQKQKIAAGKGEFLTGIGGETVKELEQAGKPLRREEIAKLQPADPLSFLVFGRTLGAVESATPRLARQAGEALAGDLGDITRMAGGRALQIGGKTAEGAAAATKAAAPVGGAIAGLSITGGIHPAATIPGLEYGIRLGKRVGNVAGEFGKQAGKVADVGAQIAGAAPMTSPLAQLGADVLQTLPGAAGEVAKGAAIDLGFNLASAQTPSEVSGPGLGAAFGVLGAGRRLAGQTLSGQLIGAREYGISRPTPTDPNANPALAQMHAEGYSGAQEGVRNRLNAIRQFVSGIAPGTDVFLAKDSESLKKALMEAGYSEKQATEAANAPGFFETNMPDANGNRRRTIVVRDIDAAPHEILHAFQAVLGEQGNAQIDALVKREFADQWDEIGRQNAGGATDWRSAILDKSGLGQITAEKKLVDSGFTTPEEAKKIPWREVLTPEEITEASDKYVAREIAAEHFDAVFKHLGVAMKEKSGLLPVFAGIVGRTIQALGGEPLSGRTSEFQNIPLSSDVVQSLKETVKPKPTIEVPGAKKTEVPPKLVKGGQPATDTDRQEAASDAQQFAEIASDKIPEVGAQSEKEVIGELANAIATGGGLKLDRLAAKEIPGRETEGEQPSGSILSDRDARRAVIEFNRTAPASIKGLWEKNFFPERIELRGKSLQVIGWSPEAFAANAHKFAKALSDAGMDNYAGYAVDPATGTFTEQSWRQLYDDVNVFVKNHMAGLTGAGGRLKIPPVAAKTEGITQPVKRGAPGGELDQIKADVISMLFGIPLPKTPRITPGKVPRNIPFAEIASATRGEPMKKPTIPRRPFTGEEAGKLGIEGREILEVNPTRGRLEKELGVNFPSFIEAIQRINIPDIARATPAPELPEFRANSLTLNTGFQIDRDNPRAVKMAAVKDEHGNIFTGNWHGEAAMRAQEAPGERGKLTDGFVTGVTDKNGMTEFLTREEALKRAQETKQLGEYNTYFPGELESGEFASNRQFQAAKKIPIELTDKDGNKYAATFDGYWDLRSLGRGFEPAFTAQEDIPGFLVKGSSTMGKSVTEKGLNWSEIPAPETQFQTSRRAEGEENPVRDVTENYVKSAGVDYKEPGDVIPVNEETAKKVADFYESAKHSPEDPEVKKSYQALIDETKAQFEAMQKAGYKIEPWTGEGEPYKSSADMVSDVRNNKHLYFLQTSKEYGQGKTEADKSNLMLQDSGVTINGIKLSANDLFRAVHDFFGHAKEGLQFGPKGELNAWREHSAMFSDDAQGALAAETLGQNSWVNYGKHLRSEGGAIPKKGEEGYKPLPERPFAEQKNIVIPEDLIAEAGGRQFQTAKKKKSDTFKFKPGKSGFSKAWIFPDGSVKQLGGQWHHEFINENPELLKKYGLKTTESGEENRQDALKKGFARVNYESNQGRVTIEARQKDWRKIKNTVYDLVNRNIDDVDNITVYLMDENAQNVVDSGSARLFNYDSDMEKLQNIPFVTQESFNTRSERQFQIASDKFSNETFDKELDKIRAGSSGGQTFNSDGTVWEPNPKKPADIVTLASINLPSGSVNRESVLKALGPYEELLDEPGVVAGIFSFSKEGAPTVSVDVNAVVPQKYRENTKKFAQDNDQVSFWDSVKGEEVKTGGKGNTRLKNVDEILDAFDLLQSGKQANPDKTSDDWGVDEIIEQRREPEPAAIQGELFGGKKYVPVGNLTKAEIAKQYPEAVIPRRRNKPINSDIVNSPLYKEAGNEEAAVKAFARRLVEFAKQWQDDPSFKLGSEWYEKFTPLLKKHFGENSQLMAELLAATSPQTNVTTNFAYAFDALQGFLSGRFKKHVEKFNEGFSMLADDKWVPWYEKELRAGRIKKPPETPTPEAFLAHWIHAHKIKPKQSNGKLFGQHSSSVLKVFARKWLELNKGPKVNNFVQNLLGTGHEATVDVWADRTMRRLGYSGFQDQWRILPMNKAGVSDADFFFSQKAFAEAAKQLGMKPDALQGALWFAEKQHWANEGWGTLDLGDFRTEMQKIPMLKKGIEQRLAKAKAEKKAKPAAEEQELFGIKPRKTNE